MRQAVSAYAVLALLRCQSAGAQEVQGNSGTRLYPGPEGTLRPITFISLGVGVEHAR